MADVSPSFRCRKHVVAVRGNLGYATGQCSAGLRRRCSNVLISEHIEQVGTCDKNNSEVIKLGAATGPGSKSGYTEDAFLRTLGLLAVHNMSVQRLAASYMSCQSSICSYTFSSNNFPEIILTFLGLFFVGEIRKNL